MLTIPIPPTQELIDDCILPSITIDGDYVFVPEYSEEDLAKISKIPLPAYSDKCAWSISPRAMELFEKHFSKQKKCICDIQQIMRVGCKCGGS